MSFFQTFMVAFLVFIILCTPVRALVGGVAEIKPFTEEDTVTKEQWETMLNTHSQFFRQFEDTNRVNILLLGVNTNLTDTIMLVSCDIDSKKIDIISVPRDTYYHRKGYDDAAERKINAAYRGSPYNTAKAVSETLEGIPINYYAVVDYEGVKNIVEAIGGVPMDIEFDMIYNDPYDKPPLHINIKKGYQTLNGEQSVQFLRYRHGYVDADIGRVSAQQEFMKSAFRQCLKGDVKKIANTVFDNVQSNITIGATLELATNAIGMKSADIKTYTIPFEPEPESPYYVYPKEEEIREMLTEIYTGVPSKTTSNSAIEE